MLVMKLKQKKKTRDVKTTEMINFTANPLNLFFEMEIEGKSYYFSMNQAEMDQMRMQMAKTRPLHNVHTGETINCA